MQGEKLQAWKIHCGSDIKQSQIGLVRATKGERGNARVNQDSINFTLEGALMGIEEGFFSSEFGVVRLTNF